VIGPVKEMFAFDVVTFDERETGPIPDCWKAPPLLRVTLLRGAVNFHTF